jgi:hypothetical protein
MLCHDQRHVVRRKLRVAGDESRPFQLSLCDQHPVKGISMMQRQSLGGDDVRHSQRQELKTARVTSDCKSIGAWSLPMARLMAISQSVMTLT